MYAKDPANHWKAKDAAIYLVTSLAAKKQTAKHGTTETSQLVNLADFFNNNIAHDLQSASVDEHPVLKADAIKYVITFRSVLPRNILLACIPCLVNLLQSKSNVVHSYAASCLERMFTLRNPGGGPPITSAELRTVKETMLKNLFAATELPGSHENEYIMKAIMRSICILQEGCLPYAGYIITQLTSKLAAVSKNPSKPQFNHYLFEAICALTRALSKGPKEDISKFEIALFPVIEEILRNDVTEFLPYVFQVLSLLLEIREGGIEGPYVSFFPLLLQPVLWERTGNIPALTRLLQAYIKRGSKQIVADNKLLSLLGVFQKLIASKANDHEGFYLLGSIVEHMEWSALEGHFKQVMIILFQRLQSSKTTKYVKGFLVFISLLAGKKSAETLISLIDSVQPKLFGMVLDKLFVPDLQKVSGTTERKICAVGVAKILTEAPIMLGEDYIQFWVRLLKALIGLFELPEDDSIPDDEHFIEIEDTPGYQTAFSQLMFAGKKEVDPFQEIADPKEFLAKQLYKLSIAHPGKLTPLISQGLEPKAAEFLQTYLHKAQVSLA